MPEDDLTELDGVGPSTAETLTDAGYATYDGISSADLDELVSVLSDVPAMTEDKIETAQSQASELATDESGDGTDAEAEDDTPERQTVEIETNEMVAMHVVHAVMAEAVRMRQRNQIDREMALYRIANELVPETSGEPSEDTDVTISADVDRNEAEFLHQAVSAAVNNYRSKNGISGLWGDLNGIVDEIDGFRSKIREH